MSEQRTRREVAERSGGLCELSGARATDMSHRVACSQGGAWTAANLLHLAHGVHMWLEAHPRLAEAGGWHLPRGTDPEAAPVWLPRLERVGWWLIQDPRDGGPHVLVPVDHEAAGLPASPLLPGKETAA